MGTGILTLVLDGRLPVEALTCCCRQLRSRERKYGLPQKSLKKIVEGHGVRIVKESGRTENLNIVAHLYILTLLKECKI
jgi:hypothetical protein